MSYGGGLISNCELARFVLDEGLDQHGPPEAMLPWLTFPFSMKYWLLLVKSGLRLEARPRYSTVFVLTTMKKSLQFKCSCI